MQTDYEEMVDAVKKRHMGPSRLYVDSVVLTKSTETIWKNLEKYDSFGFSNGFQARNLRTYLRGPYGSFWYHLELWGPTFDRFLLTFSFRSDNLFSWRGQLLIVNRGG